MARAGVTNQQIADMRRSFTAEQVERGLRLLEETIEKHRRKTVDHVRHEPIVYYMRMDRLIKIGTSTNILVRVGSIMPQGVLAVEWGGREVERRRHGQFFDMHSHLEWFWLRAPLWTHILELRESAKTKMGMDTEEWLAHHGVTSASVGASGEVPG